MHRRVAIGAAIVHVHVHVAAPPFLSWKVGKTLEGDTLRDSLTRRHVHVGTKHLVLGTSPHFDVHLSCRHGELARSRRMEIRVLELALAAIERFIGMAPRIVWRIAPAL